MVDEGQRVPEDFAVKGGSCGRYGDSDEAAEGEGDRDNQDLNVLAGGKTLRAR